MEPCSRPGRPAHASAPTARRGACCHSTALACLGLTRRQLCATALSSQAVAALAVRHGVSWPAQAQAKQRQQGGTATMTADAAATRPLRIDSAVHVWAPVELSCQYPYAGQLLGAAPSSEPPVPGHADLLLEAMQQAGVDGALIVQPGNHLYDHSYVSSVLKAHPSKFVGCLLADPTEGGGGAEAIRQLASEGYRAVRFNPYLWPEGQLMTNKVGREMYEQAGALGLPVSHMPFKGFLRHVDEIEALIQGCPDTKVIIDHFGFCNCTDLQSEEWRRLLALARHPQVHVKASAFFRVSSAQWPYEDARRGLRALVATFGAERVMFGTDWPWITEKCSYAKAWSILDGQEGAEPLLTEEERSWVTGDAIQRLFPDAWSTGIEPSPVATLS